MAIQIVESNPDYTSFSIPKFKYIPSATKDRIEQGNTTMQKDPLLHGLIAPYRTDDFSNDPNALSGKLKPESRDEPWATKAKAFLNDYLAKAPYLDKSIRTCVHCRSTKCEVAGALDPAASVANMNIAMNYLQSES